jgi:hypothetical protein
MHFHHLLLAVLLISFSSFVHSSTDPNAQYEAVYNLTVAFDKKSQQQIYEAGEQVVLVTKGSGNGWYTVWATFTPFDEENTISWNSSYSSVSLYAAKAVHMINGASLLSGITLQSAGTAECYTFKSGDFDSSPDYVDWVSNGQMGIINNDTSPRVFGIAQGISVNGNTQVCLFINNFPLKCIIVQVSLLFQNNN